MSKLKSLRDLCLSELEDIYDAEKQIVKALPKIVKATSGSDLRNALEHHLEQTKGHVGRLEQVFQNLSVKSKGRTCHGIKGILAEGETFLSNSEQDVVRDAGIIAASQRVEHYEMAVYGALRTWMDELGDSSSARLLQETLDEEKEADKKLTSVATSSANSQAQAAAH
ncbi:MAG TPA: ferritin-like domain-containing protein [Terriglobia bacterium]|nr:ferritin-like domain-containing protein [Terriglobia bacterium]